MPTNIALSSGIRSNLLNLQGTAELLAQSQNRIATGKKVNSALDNPQSFFTSAALQNRANDLNSILDQIATGVKTIEAADKGLKTLTTLVETAKSIANQALQAGANVNGQATGATTLGVTAASTITTGGVLTLQNGAGPTTSFTIANGASIQSVVDQVNGSNAGYRADLVTVGAVQQLKLSSATGQNLTTSGTAITTGTFGSVAAGGAGIAAGTFLASASAGVERAAFAVQFDGIRTQIDQLIKDSSYNGKNLLNGDNLTVVFNEKSGGNQSKLDITGVTYNSTGLGISASVGSFAAEANITTAINSATNALSSIRSQAAAQGSNLGIVNARQSFTKDLIATLQTGADGLVLADTNEEAANLLALQTRQQLSQTALSLASQQQQGVLRLFG